MMLQPLNPHFRTCTFSIHCPMSPTDPPVKVLLTDCRYVGWICPMKQKPLIHTFQLIELLHLFLLPRDGGELKKKKKREKTNKQNHLVTLVQTRTISQLSSSFFQIVEEQCHKPLSVGLLAALCFC